MSKVLGIAALLALAFSPVFAQEKKAAGPNTAATIKQMEQDWSEAQKTGNIEKLSQMIADDWRGQGPDGKISTKAEMLADTKDGKSKLESFEMGPMEVKVLGNIAICQGSGTEKSMDHGKDSSGKWVWMDVFVNRGGKWLAVRSQSSKAQD